MFNKSVHLTNGLMTPRLAVHIPPIPVETITSPIMEAYALNAIIAGMTIRVKSCFFGSLSNVVEKYYRKILGCLCSTALPCFVIEHIEDAATEVFKVPKSVADTL